MMLVYVTSLDDGAVGFACPPATLALFFGCAKPVRGLTEALGPSASASEASESLESQSHPYGLFALGSTRTTVLAACG